MLYILFNKLNYVALFKFFLVYLVCTRRIFTRNFADVYFLGHVFVIVLAEGTFVQKWRIKTSRWNLTGKFGLHCGSEDNEPGSRFRHARINCTGNSFLAEQQFTEQTGLISRRSATFLARIARIINLFHDVSSDTLVYKISLDDGKANENDRFEKTCFFF